MTNTWLLYYVFLALSLNSKAIHAYARLCGGMNGTTTCCAGFQWDIVKQLCIPCKTGYTGMNCDTNCVYPSFGKDCQSTCKCKETDCDHVVGCTNSTRETVLNICNGVNGTSCCSGYQWDRLNCIPCEAGYSGLNCTIKCFYPLYGQGCQSTCKCTKEDCDYMYGCKNPTENICSGINGTECCHGYKWSKEVTKCIQTPTTLTQVISRKVFYSNVYQTVSTDRKRWMLMIGIGVLAAVALFIVLVILFTYLLENSKRERFQYL